MKRDIPELPLHPFSFFYLSFFFSLKLIHFHMIKSLMKPDTFNSTKLYLYLDSYSQNQ